MWLKDGVRVGTGAVYVVPAVTEAHAGSYVARAINIFGGVTGSATTVTVKPAVMAAEGTDDCKAVVHVPKTVSKTELGKVNKDKLVMVLNGELDLRTAIEEAGGTFDS